MSDSSPRSRNFADLLRSGGFSGVVHAQDAGVEADVDADGTPNHEDNCPFTFNPLQADTDQDGLGNACDEYDDRDPDRDTILSERDNCPFVANLDQADEDGDGIGDACDGEHSDDLDGDGVVNADDNCPYVANAGQADDDLDGVGDSCDDNDVSLAGGVGCSLTPGASGSAASSLGLIGLALVLFARRRRI